MKVDCHNRYCTTIYPPATTLRTSSYIYMGPMLHSSSQPKLSCVPARVSLKWHRRDVEGVGFQTEKLNYLYPKQFYASMSAVFVHPKMAVLPMKEAEDTIYTWHWDMEKQTTDLVNNGLPNQVAHERPSSFWSFSESSSNYTDYRFWDEGRVKLLQPKMFHVEDVLFSLVLMQMVEEFIWKRQSYLSCPLSSWRQKNIIFVVMCASTAIKECLVGNDVSN